MQCPFNCSKVERVRRENDQLLKTIVQMKREQQGNARSMEVLGKLPDMGLQIISAIERDGYYYVVALNKMEAQPER